jgi:hypothetical protein
MFGRTIHPLLVGAATILVGIGNPSGHEHKRPVIPDDGDNVLWMDPGDSSSVDFEFGAGGSARRPQPPYRFVSEDDSGTSAKINVKDDRGVSWNIKFGEEANPSTFCTRLVWACGYFVPTEYFVERGRIEGTHGLVRAKDYVSQDGAFVNGRFQLRSDSPRYLPGQGWTWVHNPFVGTHELQGLKILMLLVSNWDTKDARDFVTVPDKGLQMDSNLVIFADDSTGQRRYLYSNDDWGAAMGRWGNFFARSKWDCLGFAEQTPHLAKLLDDGTIEWGFHGKHWKDITDIKVSDVQWLLHYLGRITDEQIRRGLVASGATSQQTGCYTRALRQRIQQLEHIAGLH